MAGHGRFAIKQPRSFTPPAVSDRIKDPAGVWADEILAADPEARSDAYRAGLTGAYILRRDQRRRSWVQKPPAGTPFHDDWHAGFNAAQPLLDRGD